MAENQKRLEVFGDMTDEDGRLENLGHEQELKRSFGLLSMIGFSFSVVTSSVTCIFLEHAAK
ncbi:hypothetical protein N7539_002075 [Penicillium diatomitis]|uniref:Uncharacterized protein n=1 Tax=Penicillium diatomitis TaxID=2819901 RepID=A0A9X0C0U5_9EURO|nr:uncharacterized protein N7539_002075 [Penicillium diatomitis]KAJ5493329.1 hypothetical protein N7539_002075 [Penicillium diatomitis]